MEKREVFTKAKENRLHRLSAIGIGATGEALL
jgi:hypothetical protein